MLSNKKNILVFIDWYLPGYKAGGPIQSVSNIVEHLKDRFDFSIVTRNSDFNSTEIYSGIKSNEWNKQSENYRIFYTSEQELTNSMIKEILEESNYHAIYFNSLFSKHFMLKPLRLAKKMGLNVVLAPRGMLSTGALQLKRFKKSIFLFFAKRTGLFKNITWHASTIQEQKEITAVFGKKAKVITALNLSPKRELIFMERKKEENKLNLFFLSRISPVKNLLKVFDYLEQIPDDYLVNFDIIGTTEDEHYWQECKQSMQSVLKTKKNIHINFLGPIPNKDLYQYLIHYHFLILPTLNENFGHSILEAVSAGCGLIISDQTPWKYLDKKQIGWDLSLTNDTAFVNAICEAAKMDQNNFLIWSRNAFNEATKYYNDMKSINDNIKLFEN